jgi:hypothetical protein
LSAGSMLSILSAGSILSVLRFGSLGSGEALVWLVDFLWG